MLPSRTLYRHLLSAISQSNPGFTVNSRHHLAYEIREGLLLTGYLIDLSGLERGAFYLNAFVQPLYVPHDHIFLTYGKRLRKGMRWVMNAENQAVVIEEALSAIEGEGKPLLEKLGSTKKLAAITEAKSGSKENPFGWRENDPNMLETRGYAWTLLGDQKRAQRDLLYITQVFVPTYEWEKDLQNRCLLILNALNKDIEMARIVLTDWAKQSALNLKLNV